MSLAVPITDTGVKQVCPSYSLLGEWAVQGTSLETKGNDCYVEYSFPGTGVSIYVWGNSSTGVYSCQLDDWSPQWFNASWSGTGTWSPGCTISGVKNGTHTLKVTNGPLSGWALCLGGIAVTTGDAFAGTNTFTSSWPAYQFPPNLATQTSTTVAPVTTVTVTSSMEQKVVPMIAFIAVTVTFALFYIVVAFFALRYRLKYKDLSLVAGTGRKPRKAEEKAGGERKTSEKKKYERLDDVEDGTGGNTGPPKDAQGKQE